jgi:NAD(P)-dependent dehydrogenase (short-subunit alcohol dehydrogenase family)
MAEKEIALIVGVGPGLSASMARLFKKDGMQVALAARDAKKLDGLVKEIDGRAYGCDAGIPKDVEKLFDSIGKDIGEPNLVVYNASGRVRGPITELDPEEVRKTIMITCYAGFLVGQAAAKRMLKAGRGTILFTGASASVKGFDRSGAKHGSRAAAAEYPCRPGGNRRRDMQPGAPGTRHIARSRWLPRPRCDCANVPSAPPAASQHLGVPR